MSTFKRLAGQTALYGLSSILGRFLTFFLTPLHTTVLSKSDYGVNTDLYAIIAFLMVFLTFGMETTFFRFYRKGETEDAKVLSHTLFPVFGFGLFGLVTSLLFLPQIAEALRYSAHPEYPLYAYFIVMLDAICAVPFARLRAENRAWRFVTIRLTQILLFFLLNYFFLSWCPALIDSDSIGPLIQTFYDPEMGVGYIFIANLIASGIMLLLLLPQFKGFKAVIDWSLEKRYLAYATPLVIAGLAGIANEMADRQFLKYLLVGDREKVFGEMGMYGANYKIATFMMMFIQAFRFAAEPFFFSKLKDTDLRLVYADVLKYFTLFQVLIYTTLVAFIDVVKWFIDEKYWSGLYLAPILLFANLLLGVNLNLNMWYKLEDKTRFGAYITFIGFGCTAVFNIWLIPQMGIRGAALATLISYFAMTVSSYYLNQKHFHTPYATGRILLYLLIAAGLAYVFFVPLREVWLWKIVLLLAFSALCLFLERKALSQLLQKKTHDR